MHCCFTIDAKCTVHISYLTTCTGVWEASRHYHLAFECDLIILSTINYMCDEALTPARFSCICHMRELFVNLSVFMMRIIWKTIAGNPWSFALHLPPVGHNTKYVGEQNILLNSSKCMTLLDLSRKNKMHRLVMYILRHSGKC